MNHGDFMYELQTRLESGVVGVSEDASTISIQLNRAYQFAYQYCLDHFPWFYVTSHSFTNVSAILYSSLAFPFRKLHAIEVPTATFGMAREAGFDEYFYINGIPQLAGRAGNPIYKVDKSQITISPACTGTLYYYKHFGDIADTDLTANITTLGTQDAILHPAFEEIVVLNAMISAYSRHMQVSELNMRQQDDMISLIGAQQDKLNRELEPLVSWQKVIPAA